MFPWRRIATRRPAAPSITPVKTGAGPPVVTGPTPPFRGAPLPVGGSRAVISAGGAKMSRVGIAALAAPFGRTGVEGVVGAVATDAAGDADGCGGGSTAGAGTFGPENNKVARSTATPSKPITNHRFCLSSMPLAIFLPYPIVRLLITAHLLRHGCVCLLAYKKYARSASLVVSCIWAFLNSLCKGNISRKDTFSSNGIGFPLKSPAASRRKFIFPRLSGGRSSAP